MTQPTTYDAVLEQLGGLRRATDVVVATMTAGLIWPRYSTNDLDLLSMAPMGAASSVGLGIAVGRPDLGVIVLDADGSLLMNLGSLVTIGGQKPAHFLHVVMENGAYGITGGQELPGTGTQHVPSIAESLGYTRGIRWSDPSDLSAAVEDMHAGKGPILLAIPATQDVDLSQLAGYLNHENALRAFGRTGFENLRAGIQASEVTSTG